MRGGGMWWKARLQLRVQEHNEYKYTQLLLSEGLD